MSDDAGSTCSNFSLVMTNGLVDLDSNSYELAIDRSGGQTPEDTSVCIQKNSKLREEACVKKRTFYFDCDRCPTYEIYPL
jgi:hypothetical protein